MRARHPIDRRIAVIADLPARCGDRGHRDLFRIAHEDGDAGLFPHGLHQPALDCEGADPGQDVAAVLLIGDERLLDRDLKKQVFDIHALPL